MGWKWPVLKRTKSASVLKSVDTDMEMAKLEDQILTAKTTIEELQLQARRQGKAITLLFDYITPTATGIEIAKLNQQLMALWQDEVIDTPNATATTQEETDGNEIV